MAADTNLIDLLRSAGDVLGGFVAKWGAASAGAILSLRFLPAGATRSDRLWAFLGGFIGAVEIAPVVVEQFHVTGPKVAIGIEFALGLFFMAATGELMRLLREGGLMQAAMDWVRKILGLPPAPPKDPPPPAGGQ